MYQDQTIQIDYQELKQAEASPHETLSSDSNSDYKKHSQKCEPNCEDINMDHSPGNRIPSGLLNSSHRQNSQDMSPVIETQQSIFSMKAIASPRTPDALEDGGIFSQNSSSSMNRSQSNSDQNLVDQASMAFALISDVLGTEEDEYGSIEIEQLSNKGIKPDENSSNDQMKMINSTSLFSNNLFAYTTNDDNSTDFNSEMIGENLMNQAKIIWSTDQNNGTAGKMNFKAEVKPFVPFNFQAPLPAQQFQFPQYYQEALQQASEPWQQDPEERIPKLMQSLTPEEFEVINNQLHVL